MKVNAIEDDYKQVKIAKFLGIKRHKWLRSPDPFVY